MSQPAKVQEPSMEEILASIRRIIADDDAGKPAKPVELAAPEPAPVRAAPPVRSPLASPTPVTPPMNQADVDVVMAPPAPQRTMPPEEPSDILDLTESMAATHTPPPGPAPNFRTIDGESDIVFSDRASDAPVEPATRMVEEARRQFAQNTPDRSLLSSATSAAVDSAFNSLANTVLGGNSRTLEDLVREMLRPMLKGWLDDNLPGLVERIVRAEIERVSRGRP